MPRRTSLSFPTGAPQDIIHEEQKTQVVARPVDTVATPAQFNGGTLLADALKSLNPALEAYAKEAQVKHIAQAEGDAQKQAMVDGYKSQADSITAISTNSDPHFRKQYMREQGIQAGYKLQEKVKAHLDQTLTADDMDPTKVRASLSEMRGEWAQGVNDPDYMKGFNDLASRVQLGAEAAINEATFKMLRKTTENNLRSDVSHLLSQGPTPPDGWLKNLKDDKRPANFTHSEVEATAWDIAAQVALTNLNPSMIHEFAKAPGEGIPSFADREPDKYYGVLRAIQTGLAKGKDSVDEKVKASWMWGVEGDIDRIKASGLPVSDETYKKLEDTLNHGIEHGYIKAEKSATWYGEIREASRKAQEIYKNVPLAAAGNIRSSGLPQAKQDAAVQALVKSSVDGIMNDPSLTDEQKTVQAARAQTTAALSNKMIYPEHRQVLASEFLKLPEIADGKEQMPPTFEASAALAYLYYKGLPSKAEFVNAFDDQVGKDAAHFYLQYFDALEKSPNKNVEQAWRNTVRQFRAKPAPGGGSGGDPGAPGTARFSKDQFDKLQKGAYSDLQDSRNWKDLLPLIGREGKRGVDNDTHFRTWFAQFIGSVDPQMKDDAIRAKAATEFSAQHMLVGGRWMKKSGQALAWDREKVVVLEKSLEALKPVLMLGPNGEGWQAKAGGDWKKADLYLSPDPVATSPEVLHEVIIGGEPTGMRVNLEQLSRQYNAKTGTLTNDPKVYAAALTEHSKVLDAFMKEPTSGDGFTPEKDAHFRRHFTLMHEAGYVGDKKYDEVIARLDTRSARFEKAQKLQELEAKDAVVRSDPATKALRTQMEGSELAAIKTFPKNSPNPAETLRLVKHYANGVDSQLGASVSGLVLGYAPVRYKNDAGNFIGFGYSLDRSDKDLAADLQRARVMPSGQSWDPAGSAGRTKATVKAIREGKFRLTETQAERLSSMEWERAEKSARTAFSTRRVEQRPDMQGLDPKTTAYQKALRESTGAGQDSWKKLPEAVRFSLTALRRFTKDDKDFLSAVEAFEKNDFGTVSKYVMHADPTNPHLVPALVRLLSGGTDKARMFIHQHF